MSPVSNTSARRGPRTSLRRATPKPSHHGLSLPVRHRFVTALFGAEKCAKGLEKRSRKSDLAPGQSRIGAWFGPGLGLVRAWFGPGAGLVRAWCGPGAGLVRALVRAWCGAGLVRAWCGPGAGLGNPVLATGLLPQSCCGNRIAPAIPAPHTGLP